MISSSFRDPSGYVFEEDGVIYRKISDTYKDTLMELGKSGLYDNLVDNRLMVPFKIISEDTIMPEMVKFISYPYEWSFSQLKDAALVTLEIAKRSLYRGMILKDASAYNIQFHKGRPMLIDHLSFEVYKEGEPWIAYKQFCEHFLAPLVLMSYKDVRLSQLLRIYIDGIPLDLTNSLLPLRTYFNPNLLLHIRAHSASQKRYADKSMRVKGKVGRNSLLGLIDNLESCIKKLEWKPKGTEWIDYYEGNSEYIESKKKLVEEFLNKSNPKTVWDLGSNIGLFGRLTRAQTISFDIDPACVELNYLTVKEKKESSILPLLLDLTNPSPGIGWENKERTTIWERGHADTILALALVHHLAISNNLPLNMIAGFLKNICNSLIIEFIPKSDPKIQKLLVTRKDIFPDYTQEAFEEEFGKLFTIQESKEIESSGRILYLMKEGRNEKVNTRTQGTRHRLFL